MTSKYYYKKFQTIYDLYDLLHNINYQGGENFCVCKDSVLRKICHGNECDKKNSIKPRLDNFDSFIGLNIKGFKNFTPLYRIKNLVVCDMSLKEFFKVDYEAENIYLLTNIHDEKKDKELLSSCGATNLDTKEIYGANLYLNSIVSKALNWLSSTCNLEENLTSTLDDSRLTDTANALGEYCIEIDEIAVAKTCRELGWKNTSINKTIKRFKDANESFLAGSITNYKAEDLMRIWEISDDLLPKRGYLKSISLTGLWGYKNINIASLNEDVNIFIGSNGSGKSTLLNEIWNKINRSNTKNNLTLTPDYRLLYPTCFIKTFDEPSADSRRKISKLLEELEAVVYPNNEGISFFGYRMRIMDEPDNRDSIENHINEFIKKVNELFKETGKCIEIKGGSDPKLVVKTENGITIGLGDLSSGEKQILLILIKVLLQEKKPAILIMDEPEISLHIKWQQALIDIIRTLNPSCQIILATHSPSILSKGWSDKVIFMEDITREGVNGNY